VKKSCRDRVYPTRRQQEALAAQLAEACTLYNAALQERRDFHHRTARMLVNRYGLMAVEDLHVKGLARRMFAKSILDAAWGAFILILLGKAAEAVRLGVKGDAQGPSQRCPCGAPWT
jgi:putative transposase